MILILLKQIVHLSSKNNPLLLIVWVFFFSPIAVKLIFLLITLNLLAILKFLIKASINNTIILNPHVNVIDALIIKILITILQKKNDIEILVFISFSYTWIFLFGFSLKSLEISIKIYNELKFHYTFKTYKNWNLIVEANLNFYERELLITEPLNDFNFRNWHIKIND